MTAQAFVVPPDVQTIALDEESFLEFKQVYIDDPWPFAVDICGYDRLVERFHRPLIYLYSGHALLLLNLLRDGRLQSEVTEQIRKALRQHGWNPLNFDHEDKICKFLRGTHNVRISRVHAKTSCEVAAITHIITVNPDEQIALVGMTDDTAAEIGGEVAKIIASDRYKDYFSERVPDNERSNLSANYVMLKGRTRYELKEPCLLALGHRSDWTSRHFSRMFYDDVIAYENSAPSEMRASLKIMVNFEGLRQPPVVWPGGVQESHTGTIWSRFDDSAGLEANEDCLTIKIPIARRRDGQPWTLKNFQEPNVGVPCLPEWYNEDEIVEKRKRQLRNKEQGGRTSWFCNFLLIPMEDEVLPFHPDVVDRSKFEWRLNQRTEKLEICRPATTMDREPLVNSAGKEIYFYFDPLRMRRVAAVDQARSKSRNADQWAIAVVSIDHQGFRYVLHVRVGRGYNEMLDAIQEVETLWFPDAWHIEGGGMQGTTIDWMRRGDPWNEIAGKLFEVTNWVISKAKRIRQDVAAPMEMGELLLNPDDYHTPTEAKQYNPSDPEPVDNALDAIAMASVALLPTEYQSEEQEEMANRRAVLTARAHRDEDTGLDISNWWAPNRTSTPDYAADLEVPRRKKERLIA